MAKRLPSKRKKFWKALLCWMVGCHYFYLGHPRRNILYLLTLGGCFLWMLSDLYRLPVLLDVENGRIAAEVYKNAPKVKAEEEASCPASCISSDKKKRALKR